MQTILRALCYILIVTLFYGQHCLCADKYLNFAELAASETNGVDYRITVINKQSSITAFAIHGGSIENGTSEFSRKLSERLEFNLYVFEGIKAKDNEILHITSTHFDEPQALELAQTSDECLSIHGYNETVRAQMCIGGLDENLAKSIVNNLKTQMLPFEIVFPCDALPGRDQANIVNRCKRHGVQFELSTKLRDDFKNKPDLLEQVISTIQSSIAQSK